MPLDWQERDTIASLPIPEELEAILLDGISLWRHAMKWRSTVFLEEMEPQETRWAAKSNALREAISRLEAIPEAAEFREALILLSKRPEIQAIRQEGETDLWRYELRFPDGSVARGGVKADSFELAFPKVKFIARSMS
jgi:hypothetical protein